MEGGEAFQDGRGTYEMLWVVGRGLVDMRQALERLSMGGMLSDESSNDSWGRTRRLDEDNGTHWGALRTP